MKSQDYIYLKENYYKKPKQQFFFIKNNILKIKKKGKLLDLGCAKGEFIFFLEKYLKNFDYFTGIDYSKNLIAEAKRKNKSKNINFLVKNAENFKLNKKYDIIIIAGLISYFDDPLKLINCSIRHLNKNGYIFIMDKFNENNVDLIVKYRNNKISKKFAKGWNFHSIQTIDNIFLKKRLKKKNSKKFELDIPLKPKNDPGRSFKIKTNYGNYFANGFNQYFNLTLLVYKK